MGCQEPLQEPLIEALYTARKEGSPVSGVDQIQLSVQGALATQLQVLECFEAAGNKLGGWKVGLTSANARDRMGKDFRPFGYILRSRILQAGSIVPRAKILNCSVEPEICLILGSALRGNAVTAAEAKAAVRAVAPAFEVNERRVR